MYYELVKIFFKLKDINMNNWKTTIGGILLSVGLLLTQITEPEWVPVLGTILTAIGGLLTGVAAKDAKDNKKKDPS